MTFKVENSLVVIKGITRNSENICLVNIFYRASHQIRATLKFPLIREDML